MLACALYGHWHWQRGPWEESILAGHINFANLLDISFNGSNYYLKGNHAFQGIGLTAPYFEG